MDKLPYFLVLLKKNIILCSIITNGSFSNIDFENCETVLWSDSVIDLKNFKLSEEEEFNSVRIMISDFGLHIDFQPQSSKYFNNTEKYFGRNKPLRKRKYEMFEQNVKSDSKRLGNFDGFDRPLEITLYNSSIYGQNISLFFAKKEQNKVKE